MSTIPVRADTLADDHVDDQADDEIAACLVGDEPRSFFLFAGAGSGKTRSLVTALDKIRKSKGKQLRLAGRQVGVITFTNAACGEITRRFLYDSLFSVSTIHSFIWEMLRGFNTDIRCWIAVNLAAEIGELELLLQKGRKQTKVAAERERSLLAKRKRLDGLPSIRRFTYNPNGDNRTRDSLSHAEVLKLGAAFLNAKPLCQRLLIARFPILLIDESQDTNGRLMEAFFVVQQKHRGEFVLGLFGDTMQRIYGDGKADLGANLPGDWAKPRKIMNHRSTSRIVELINKVREPVDDQSQRERRDTAAGCARLYIASHAADKATIENAVRASMALTTGDSEWDQAVLVKTLILEHHMAASRLMFLDMFRSLHKVDSFRTGLLDGSLSCVRFFVEQALRIVEAKRARSEFAVATLMRKYSPLLTEDSLKAAGGDQRMMLEAASAGVKELTDRCADGQAPTFREVLQTVMKHKLLDPPDSLEPFASKEQPTDASSVRTEGSDTGADDVSASMVAIGDFLDTPFSQIEPYSAYVAGNAPFATHQGVKGLQFPRVLVIMDDEEARGFSFSYDKLFGAKPKSKTDTDNERSGEETGIDRTRRLFYVTCSRAMDSLALLAYTDTPEAGKRE